MTPHPFLLAAANKFGQDRGLTPGPQAAIGDFLGHLIQQLGVYGPALIPVIEQVLKSGGGSPSLSSILHLVQIVLQQLPTGSAASPVAPPVQPPSGN